MDEDNPEKILYAQEGFEQAMVSIHIQSKFDNRLWIECVPSWSYHIGGWKLNILTDILLQMSEDGILEIIE